MVWDIREPANNTEGANKRLCDISLGELCRSGTRDRLDVDFLALLAHCAAAARMVSAPAKCATVEPVLELLPVLRFPGLDGKAVLLLNLVPVPLWYHVERAEGDDPQIGCEVVYVAALEPLLVLVMSSKSGRAVNLRNLSSPAAL